MRNSATRIFVFERKAMFLVLVTLLAIGMAENSGATEFPFTGTFEFHWGHSWYEHELPSVSHLGSGFASVSITGGHLASLALPADVFGPITASLPVTSSLTINSIIFTGMAPAAGTPIAGGAGAPMGLTGTVKICLIFGPCEYVVVPFPLTPTPGGAGMGIGGTAIIPGPVAITMRNMPWTLGQPTMTIHTPNSTITTPVLPGGLAPGSGPLQMVTATKVYTRLFAAFPEMPFYAVLNLELVLGPNCDDGLDDDGDGLTDFPDDPGCDDAVDDSEQSPDLVCDNGLDDDGDSLADVADDPGCHDPWDDSEQSPDLVCDNGLDDDGDGLTDFPDDPGCEHPGSNIENPECQDGINNDPAQDGWIDFDGGLSALGYVATFPDPSCTYAWQNREGRTSCGLGAELALLLPPMMWLLRRRRS